MYLYVIMKYQYKTFGWRTSRYSFKKGRAYW